MSRQYFSNLLESPIKEIKQIGISFNKQLRSELDLKDQPSSEELQLETHPRTWSTHSDGDESKTEHSVYTKIDHEEEEDTPVKKKNIGQNVLTVDVDYFEPSQSVVNFNAKLLEISKQDFSALSMKQIEEKSSEVKEVLQEAETYDLLKDIKYGSAEKTLICTQAFNRIKNSLESLYAQFTQKNDSKLLDSKNITKQPDYFLDFHEKIASINHDFDLFRGILNSFDLGRACNGYICKIEALLTNLKAKAIAEEIKQFDEFCKANEKNLNEWAIFNPPSCAMFYSTMAQAQEYQKRISQYNKWYETPVNSGSEDAIKHVSDKIGNLRPIWIKKIEQEKAKFDDLCREAEESKHYDLAKLKEYEENFKACSQEVGDPDVMENIKEISKDISTKTKEIEAAQQVALPNSPFLEVNVPGVANDEVKMTPGVAQQGASPNLTIIVVNDVKEVKTDDEVKMPHEIESFFDGIRAGAFKDKLLSQYKILLPLINKGDFYKKLVHAQLINEYFPYATASQIKGFDIFFKEFKIPPRHAQNDPVFCSTFQAVIDVYKAQKNQAIHFKRSAFDRSIHKLPESHLEVFTKHQVDAFTGFSKLLVNNIGKGWIVKNEKLHQSSHVRFNQLGAVLRDMGIDIGNIRPIFDELNQKKPNLEVLFKIIHASNLPVTTLSTFYLEVLPTVWGPSIKTSDIDKTVTQTTQLREIDETVTQTENLFNRFFENYTDLANSKADSFLNKNKGIDRVDKLKALFNKKDGKEAFLSTEDSINKSKEVLIHKAKIITLFLKHGTLGETTDPHGGCSNFDSSSARAVLLKELDLGLNFIQISHLREDQLLKRVIHQLQFLTLIQPLQKIVNNAQMCEQKIIEQKSQRDDHKLFEQELVSIAVQQKALIAELSGQPAEGKVEGPSHKHVEWLREKAAAYFIKLTQFEIFNKIFPIKPEGAKLESKGSEVKQTEAVGSSKVEKLRLSYILNDACKKVDKSVIKLPEVQRLINNFWQEYKNNSPASVGEMSRLLRNFAETSSASTKSSGFCRFWSANSNQFKEHIKSGCMQAGLIQDVFKNIAWQEPSTLST